VVNASVEFDLETLQPTFHLTIGLPGRSNALAIAERLGMPEAIINAARSELDPTELRAEDLLDEIHRQRDHSRQARAAAEEARQEAEELRAELSERLERLEDERRAVLEQAQAEAEARMRELQAEVDSVQRALARARQPLDALQSISEQVEILQESVERPVERRSTAIRGQRTTHSLRLGDKVRLRTLNTQGVVTSLGEEEAEVQVGMLRVRARLTDLEPMDGLPEQQPPAPSSRRRKQVEAIPAGAPSQSITLHASPGMELDLRGQRADEALDALDRYLDAAYLAGLPFVRIIHGKGTGKLRQSVREVLGQHPHIRSFEPGSQKEGGDGVTVAKLQTV
jgi:DNA mismatch repair protein MutS2